MRLLRVPVVVLMMCALLPRMAWGAAAAPDEAKAREEVLDGYRNYIKYFWVAPDLPWEYEPRDFARETKRFCSDRDAAAKQCNDKMAAFFVQNPKGYTDEIGKKIEELAAVCKKVQREFIDSSMRFQRGEKPPLNRQITLDVINIGKKEVAVPWYFYEKMLQGTFDLPDSLDLATDLNVIYDLKLEKSVGAVNDLAGALEAFAKQEREKQANPAAVYVAADAGVDQPLKFIPPVRTPNTPLDAKKFEAPKLSREDLQKKLGEMKKELEAKVAAIREALALLAQKEQELVAAIESWDHPEYIICTRGDIEKVTGAIKEIAADRAAVPAVRLSGGERASM